MLNPFTQCPLEKKTALLCLRIEKNLLRHFPDPAGKKFLLAFSGGKDSTLLTFIFSILGRRNKFDLFAAHINHQLRTDADEDEEFCKEFCHKLNIPIKTLRFDLSKYAKNGKIGVEEAGHKARINLFEYTGRELGCVTTVVAHHAGDLLEDALMRFIRGAGWPALGGMRERIQTVYRPLLSITPSEISECLSSEKLFWKEDSTNNSMEFFRNRIRHKIIPVLHKENPSLEKNAVHINRMAEIDRDYWDNQVKEFFSTQKIFMGKEGQLIVPISDLKNYHQALRLRIYMYGFKLLAKYLVRKFSGNAQTFFLLDEDIIKNRQGKIFQFPGNFYAEVINNSLKFNYRNM